MTNKKVHRIKTITEYHRVKGLPKPENHLISLIKYEDIKQSPENNLVNWVLDFYSISLKRNISGKMKYGQQQYDFDEGVMFFISPNQVFGIEVPKKQKIKPSGWILLVHPDFLWKTSLTKSIKKYVYFDYSVHEALFLSDKEETTIEGILKNIQNEYHLNIDKFSQDIIISQLETLLNYAERFYHRQFLTRKISNHEILNRMEDMLSEYFSDNSLLKKGLPAVQTIADSLNVSANYLSVLLKVLTGQSTQQHIHDKLIEKAKEKLSTSDLSVSEIAYALGFEYPQSFSKMFKLKTNLSPMEFRQSLN